MKSKNYREKKNMPYTRREYVHGVPGSKIVKFSMGTPSKDYEVVLSLISLKSGQIRHNALEAARIAVNRYLELNLGREGYAFKIIPYPHQILREHKVLAVAQADRFQEGMKLAYGKPVGVAARVGRGERILLVKVRKEDIKTAEEALRRGSHKLPIKCRLVLYNE